MRETRPAARQPQTGGKPCKSRRLIAVPGMPRTDLEGVLVGMLMKYLDDGSALDELHARISEALGHNNRCDDMRPFPCETARERRQLCRRAAARARRNAGGAGSLRKRARGNEAGSVRLGG